VLEFIGGRGRNRIFNRTYFQQHAGQRMTPKTLKISRSPINRAQMERVFAAFLPFSITNVDLSNQALLLHLWSCSL
jgi:hypothetical protein